MDWDYIMQSTCDFTTFQLSLFLAEEHCHDILRQPIVSAIGI